MNLKQLSWFVELVKSGNFTKAAKKMYIDQSTLSKGIKAMEKDMGIPLIDRTANCFRLTPEGEILYQLGGETLKNIEGQLEHLRDRVNEDRGGKVRVGIPPVIDTAYFADIIPKFEKECPNIKLEVMEIGANIVRDKVDSGEVDVGVVILPLASDDYDILPVFKNDNVLVVNKDHPLAGKDSVTFKELEHEPLLSLDSSYMLYNRTLSLCFAAGFEPKFKLLSPQWDMLARLCELNYGVGILPRPIMSYFRSNKIKLLSLTEPEFPWNIALIVRKDKYLSNPIRRFREFVKRCGDIGDAEGIKE
ncbi:MAG: LysR family transcriptional regulator [Lachnospiraceae bacterium]|nr:LysR family transcriptional regulator [Lachnospiraceae bacterium]